MSIKLVRKKLKLETAATIVFLNVRFAIALKTL